MKNQKKRYEKYFSNILVKISDIKNVKENEKLIIHTKKLEKILKKYYLKISEKKKIKNLKKNLIQFSKINIQSHQKLEKRLKKLKSKLNLFQKKPFLYNLGQELTKNVEKTNSSYIINNNSKNLKSTKTVNSSPNDGINNRQKSNTLNTIPNIRKSPFFGGSEYIDSEDLISPKRINKAIKEELEMDVNNVEFNEQLDTIYCMKNYINKFKNMMVVDPDLEESKNKIKISQKKINDKFFKLLENKKEMKDYDSDYSDINPLGFLENN